MIFGQDRQELRQMYSSAWRKSQSGAILSALETQIVRVINDHPEYQKTVSSEVEDDYTPDGGKTNPFLHMGLHLALRDQIATDRPSGIAAVFAAIVTKTQELHAAEHLALDCLAETLWESQNQNTAPDEIRYLERLNGLIR